MTALGALHARSIVIDAVSPLAASDPAYLQWYRDGGVTALAPTVGGVDDLPTTIATIASWRKLVDRRDDLRLITDVAAIREAKASGKLGVYFHFQGTEPIGENLDLIRLFKHLGVGMVQLTYNARNRVGDGCEEPGDAGLSRFGRDLIAELNAAGVIVDCSHAAPRTAREAIEASSAPVVLSHSNVAAVQPHPRNVSNELITAIARSGGIVGLAGFPPMVWSSKKPTIDDFIRHIDAVAALAGIDHVGLGIDYYSLQSGVASDADAKRGYDKLVASGLWSEAYPPPPHHYPAGIADPRTLWALSEALESRGYADEDIAKILGLNWLRVMKTVWN